MSEKISGKVNKYSQKESTMMLSKIKQLKKIKTGSRISTHVYKKNSHKQNEKSEKRSSNKMYDVELGLKSTHAAVLDPRPAVVVPTATEEPPVDELKQTASGLLQNKEFIVEYAAHQQRVKKKMDNILTPFSQRKESEVQQPIISEDKLVDEFKIKSSNV